MSRLAAAVGPVASAMVKRSDGPTFKEVRTFIDKVAAERGEWGGAPMPMEHVELVMEPRYPFPLHGKKFGQTREKPEKVDYTVLNTWRVESRDTKAVVCREANGKSRVYFMGDGAGARLTYWLNTLGVVAGHAWDVQVEARANVKLKELVSEHAFHCYQLAGGFLETSKRSGVQYLFRKLRPTLALRPDSRGSMRVIAALCLHPLGYYAKSWAGVMCPTDDVVAHLMLMRGDEPRFWRKANQHPFSIAAAGV